MPPQPRKKTSKKRKISHTKTAKRKRSSRKIQSRVKRDLWIALVLIVLVFASGAGYYFNKSDTYKNEVTKKQVNEKIPEQKEKRAIEVKEKKPKQQSVTAENKTEFEAAHEISRQREKAMRATYKNEPFVPEEKIVLHTKTPFLVRGKRPRLVIIIDDVGNSRELKEIRSIPLKLTPSLFPPSRYSKDTARMAKGLKHYMIHFPMEAGNHPRGAMPDTVTVKDSKERMRARVKNLRKWFSVCIYINNHTGSVFTSDYHALHTIYGLMKEEGFVFVDSRTSPKSKGKRVAKEYGDFYLHRDVFIDNVQKFGDIRKQLKIAVKKAKKRGYAIVIGHPHKMTLRTLKNSLDILVDVDVVYMDDLM